jgi:Holliday junction resolvase RusA-like endonuclease
VFDPITIVVLGTPVPWARAGGKGKQRFTPAKQRGNAETLRGEASRAFQEQAGMDRPLSGAVRLDIRAEFRIAKSWSKKKQAAAMTGEFPHIQKPDLDNITKQVKDALKSVVYDDDSQVNQGWTEKVWSYQPKLVITVRPSTARRGI